MDYGWPGLGLVTKPDPYEKREYAEDKWYQDEPEGGEALCPRRDEGRQDSGKGQ